MTILLSSFEGGGSMIMPKAITDDTFITIKGGAKYNSAEALFYTRLEDNYDELGFETATLQNTADTSEQTVVDTGTGISGVLTSALSPRVASGVEVTIRVTIDGNETAFTLTSTNTGQAMVVGSFTPWSGVSTSTDIGYGSQSHQSYTVLSTRGLCMLSPMDTLTQGLPVGMVFKDSLKVTVQASANFIVGSTTNKAAAAWLNYIPEGL